MAAELKLDEIQGNILAGFKNDFITFLFLRLSGDARRARGWLADVIADVATTTEVKTFNDFFRLASRSGAERPEASWMNLALTQSGLRALAVDDAELDQLPEEFQEGMRARAELIGDTGDDAPANWPNGLGYAAIDALMIVADDNAAHRNTKVNDFVVRASTHGATVVLRVHGMRREQRELEHFGYRDGISQPAVVGFTDDRTPDLELAQARADDFARDVEPGEFVLGYPGEPAPPGSTTLDPSNPQPSWLENGSFLVFRRLWQNVPGFHEFVGKTAVTANMAPELLRAKLVGRYPSGVPLVGMSQSEDDPGLKDPDLLERRKINDFAYKEDADGTDVPRAAHIRKTNPRDQELDGDDVRRRRILRRGIPFGRSYDPDREDDGFYGGKAERGLCFVCYQRSIADQFEHIQTAWMNTDSHPRDDDGIDPLATRVPGSRYCAVPGAVVSPILLDDLWVRTTAGEYFFAPSIAAMKHFARVG